MSKLNDRRTARRHASWALCAASTAVLFALSPHAARAQGEARPGPTPPDSAAHNIRALPGQNVAVRLRDGSTVMGRVERADGDSVVVVGSAGRLALPRASVDDVRAAGSAHTRANGSTDCWFENPNATRLFFGPTGRTLARGQGYVADFEVVIASAHVGLTDRVMVGGGGLLIPGVPTVWFVSPKVGLIRGDQFNLSVGAVAGGVGDYGDALTRRGGDIGGIAYVAGTYGSPDHSLTLAVGDGFAGSKVSGQPAVMLGGETRVARRISLVSENYILPTVNAPLVSYGLRFMGEKIAVDLAFFNFTDGRVGFPGIPYVDFVFRF